MEYRFEEIQHLRFVVYDIDDRGHIEEARRHDLIGEMQCTLADVVTGGQFYERNLRVPGEGLPVLEEELLSYSSLEGATELKFVPFYSP